MTENPSEILSDLYNKTLKNIEQKISVENELTQQQLAWITYVALKSESQKAIPSALITSLIKKIENPKQDIRQHKTDLPNGYSGRSLDTKIITPFLKRNFGRIAMKESGWLTRSIEQPVPFDLKFSGKIRDKKVKEAFLKILDDVQINNFDPKIYLLVLFEKLILQKKSYEESQKQLTKSVKVINSEIMISKIINCLECHFFSKYNIGGASRLPVIAIYSIYEIMMNDVKKYENKILKSIKDHTTSDVKSHELGDIEVVDESNEYYESIEIKHNIQINSDHIIDIKNKIRDKSINRYYLLTTAMPNIDKNEEMQVSELVLEVKLQHGCEIIVNGVMNSIKYYLRLAQDPQEFIKVYTNNLKKDFENNTDVKQIHIDSWNKILTKLQ